jgi:hypothetical protein
MSRNVMRVKATNCADTQTGRKRAAVAGPWHKLEKMHQQLGTEEEVCHGVDCHGGDSNDVADCRPLMAKANRFCDLWLKLVPELHDPAQTTVTVDELCQRMQRATPRFAGKLNAVFSMVSGVNFLLPTPEDASNFGDSD